jgi:hypothetical protein
MVVRRIRPHERPAARPLFDQAIQDDHPFIQRCRASRMARREEEAKFGRTPAGSCRSWLLRRDFWA